MVFTMPEFLERRFSPASRYVLSVVSLITFMVSKIAVGIFAGGVVFSTLLPEMQLHLGGLRDRQLLDRLGAGDRADRPVHQCWAACGPWPTTTPSRPSSSSPARRMLTIYGLYRLGGWHELRQTSAARTCSTSGSRSSRPASRAPGRRCSKRTRPDNRQEAWYFNGNFPWLGMAICAPVIGLWYWCTDQYIVQRALGARTSRRPAAAASSPRFLKLFPVYLFIIPGLICFALAKSGKVPELAATWCADGKPIAPGPGGLPADGASICCRPDCAASWWPGCSRP